MKSISVKTPHDSSFSFSRRYLHWRCMVQDEEDEEEILTFNSSSHSCHVEREDELILPVVVPATTALVPRKKLPNMAVSKLRWALTIFNGKSRSRLSSGLGRTKVIGTLFGYRRGHVHIAFQEDPKLNPGFLIELAMPTSVLVREMASGLVRIALECERKVVKKGAKLLEEPLWRTYCNGKKCGHAMRRDCGPEEWKVLKAVEPISMGAGVLPAGNSNGNGGGDGSEGEVMYMRAKFERVVGSKDSEAFYMMNPDGSGGPELSFFMLRV